MNISKARQVIDAIGKLADRDLSNIKIMASDSINEKKIKEYNMQVDSSTKGEG